MPVGATGLHATSLCHVVSVNQHAQSRRAIQQYMVEIPELFPHTGDGGHAMRAARLIDQGFNQSACCAVAARYLPQARQSYVLWLRSAGWAVPLCCAHMAPKNCRRKCFYTISVSPAAAKHILNARRTSHFTGTLVPTTSH
jgi:hypothetical protein